MQTDLLKIDRLWELICSALSCVNKTFVEHGERVAYCALRYCEATGLETERTKRLVFSALFHDIGAYKTDEHDALLQFDAVDSFPHSLAGYLFLKYFSPLAERAMPILYHHRSFAETDGTLSCNEGILLHLFDRFDVLKTANFPLDKILKRLDENAGTKFDPAHWEVFRKLLTETSLNDKLDSGVFLAELNDFLKHLEMNEEKTIEYLKMLFFTFEVYSYSTLYHSNTTATLAYHLGALLNLADIDVKKLYLAGLIHDLGKIKTPKEVLEKPSALTSDEMAVMRCHVSDTALMTKGYFDDEIVRIASRHHEKLNGSGYPDRLTERDLTVTDRILCVADIVSALFTKRSYKSAFDTEKAFRILTEMKDRGELDVLVVETFLKNSDFLLAQLSASNAEISRRYHDAEEEYKRLQHLTK